MYAHMQFKLLFCLPLASLHENGDTFVLDHHAQHLFDADFPLRQSLQVEKVSWLFPHRPLFNLFDISNFDRKQRFLALRCYSYFR